MFSEHQIVNILKEYELGKATKDICSEHGISAAKFYLFLNSYHKSFSHLNFDSIFIQ